MFAEAKGRLRDVRTLTRLFEAAERAALRDGQDVPGPEHVVVGALALEDGTAAATLTAVGIDPTTVESRLRRAHASALGIDDPADPDADDGPITSPAAPRSTPYRMTSAGERFVRTVHDVHVREGGRLRGALVLLASTELTSGVWPRVLAAAGVTPGDLRAAALRHLEA